MPNLEWTVPHTLVTPLGELDLNVADGTTGREYLILPTYSILPTLRVTQDNLSQADGATLHPRWKTGLVASLAVKYIIRTGGEATEYEPACGADLREMHDDLMRHLDSIRKQSGEPASQRLIWTPSGGAVDLRMIDAIQLLAWPVPDRSDNEDEVAFSVETPYPYAIDLTETDTDLADGVEVTITNVGSSEFKPVIEVVATGSVSTFSIINAGILDDVGNPLELVFDASLPGAAAIPAGHYLELDFWKATATLDGDVDGTYIAGIDAQLTDWFPLVVGDNPITLVGASGTVKWNTAWS